MNDTPPEPPEDQPEEVPLKLDLWFANPTAALRDNRTETSDGGFLVLSGALALYERYLVKKFPGLSTAKENYPERDKLWGGDLGIQPDHFNVFWDCFRNGLQHQFQPKSYCGKIKYNWDLSSHYFAAPKVKQISDKLFSIQVNPWEFAALVLRRYSDNPELMSSCKSHKLGEIHPIAESQQTPSKALETPAPTSRPFRPTLSQNPKSPIYQIAPIATGKYSEDSKPKPYGEE